MIGSRWRAAAEAVFYNCIDATMPVWAQWTMHTFQLGAPVPSTLGGIEWSALSLLAWWYGYPPAVAFVVSHLAGVYAHPLRRQTFDGAVESSLVAQMRWGFVWFCRVYVITYGLKHRWPRVFHRAIVWTSVAS